jgi:ferrous iron transport protein A
MRLDELPKGGRAVVTTVHRRSADDAIAQRLMELGFVSGEPVRLLATGPLGGEPLLVQVGYTRFALRRAEAARIEVAMEGKDQ